MHPTFLSCDWGTTSFRLRWVESASGRVLAADREATGIKRFVGLEPAERAAAMARHLAEKIAQWPAVPPGVPVVVSGMAGSSVGWCELPYAVAPFALDGSGAVIRALALDGPGGVARRALLVSGVRTEDDILRGEECAVIGLAALRPDWARGPDPVHCVTAGTHPKHLRLQGGRLTGFRTHLTGELFDVLARASLLAASVDLSAVHEAPAWDDFRAGVRTAARLGLAAALFQVRARQILAGAAAARNAWFLSGLLIGGELAGTALAASTAPICVLGEPALTALYREALAILAPAEQPPAVLTVSSEEAVIAGHAQLLRVHAAAGNSVAS